MGAITPVWLVGGCPEATWGGVWRGEGTVWPTGSNQVTCTLRLGCPTSGSVSRETGTGPHRRMLLEAMWVCVQGVGGVERKLEAWGTLVSPSWGQGRAGKRGCLP